MSNFVKVYRGTHGAHWHMQDPDHYVLPETGMHWTADPIVAYHFARHGGLATTHHNHPENLLPPEFHFGYSPEEMSQVDMEVDPRNPQGQKPRVKPVVLEGWAHKSSIVTPKSPEWENLAETHQIYDPDADEQQITVRPGSTVHVSKIHMVGPQFDVQSFGIPRPLQIRRSEGLHVE